MNRDHDLVFGIITPPIDPQVFCVLFHAPSNFQISQQVTKNITASAGKNLTTSYYRIGWWVGHDYVGYNQHLYWGTRLT